MNPNGLIDDYKYVLSFPKFVMFGDSITQKAFSQFPLQDMIEDGYTTKEANPPVVEFNLGLQLIRDYTRRMDVLNRGFSGYNSKMYRLMIDKILSIENDTSHSKIELATLFLGTNDAAHAPPDGIPYPEFIENMDYIINRILKSNIKLILIGPAHHYSDIWNPLNQEDVSHGITRDSATNLKYSKGLEQLAIKYHIPFLNLFKLFETYNIQNHNQEATKDLFLDGIHFNGKGYRLMYCGLRSIIDQYYPEYSLENMPFVMPDWVKFDATKAKNIG